MHYNSKIGFHLHECVFNFLFKDVDHQNSLNRQETHKMVLVMVIREDRIEHQTIKRLIKIVMENTIQRMTHIQAHETADTNKATNSMGTIRRN